MKSAANPVLFALQLAILIPDPLNAMTGPVTVFEFRSDGTVCVVTGDRSCYGFFTGSHPKKLTDTPGRQKHPKNFWVPFAYLSPPEPRPQCRKKLMRHSTLNFGNLKYFSSKTKALESVRPRNGFNDLEIAI